MILSEFAGSDGQKADLFKRAAAFVIDAIIASVLMNIVSALMPFLSTVIGGLVGGAYVLLRDGLAISFLNGMSVGKHVMKLRLTGPADHIDYLTSMKRNVTLGFIFLCYPVLIIPFLGSFVFFIAAVIQMLLLVTEVYRVFTDPEGKRIGDLIAETKVLEV